MSHASQWLTMVAEHQEPMGRHPGFGGTRGVQANRCTTRSLHRPQASLALHVSWRMSDSRPRLSPLELLANVNTACTDSSISITAPCAAQASCTCTMAVCRSWTSWLGCPHWHIPQSSITQNATETDRPCIPHPPPPLHGSRMPAIVARGPPIRSLLPSPWQRRESSPGTAQPHVAPSIGEVERCWLSGASSERLRTVVLLMSRISWDPWWSWAP